MKFEIRQSGNFLSSQAGLSLVGEILKLYTSLEKRIDKAVVKGVQGPQISNSDVVKSFIGLLCQAKNDFDNIEQFRNDDFFAFSLGIDTVPSSPTLRQRMNLGALNSAWKAIIQEEMIKLLKKSNAPLTPITLKMETEAEGRVYMPFDMDSSPFDNSDTKKEGVSRTYKQIDGYCPIFAYLGKEGYCINTELREGKSHVQKGTPEFIAQSIRYAKEITSVPLLIMLDSGHDSQDNIDIMLDQETSCYFIIKRNLRKESPQLWHAIAQEHGEMEKPREGKNVYYGSQTLRKATESAPEVRLIYEVIERTIDKKGQLLLVPDIEVNTFFTVLPDEPKTIVHLYHEHGTSEQFHSELKTDMNLERLPSGKFATNDLVLRLGVFAYNILRLIGQFSIKSGKEPLRKQVARRRIRTVIDNVIRMAVQFVRHARKYILDFGCHSPWLQVFSSIHQVCTR